MKQAVRLLHICSERVRQLATAGIVSYFGGEPRQGERWLVDFRLIDELMNVALSATTENDLVMRWSFRHSRMRTLRGAATFSTESAGSLRL